MKLMKMLYIMLRKLIWKYEKTSGEDSKLFINALWDMIGKDSHMLKLDKGSREWRVTARFLNCFKAIEVVTYQLIENGYKKEYVHIVTLVLLGVNFRLGARKIYGTSTCTVRGFALAV